MNGCLEPIMILRNVLSARIENGKSESMDIILTGLKVRLMLILYNKSNWLSVKMIKKILDTGFKAGSLNKAFSYNRICVALRELNDIGLLDKKTASSGNWGRTMLYNMTIEGVEALKNNMLIPEEIKNVGLVEKTV